MARKSYIRFEVAPQAYGRKTSRWIVVSISSGNTLGWIDWRIGWRQYVFEPNDNTSWSSGCLRDVIAFLDAQNLKQRTKEETA